MCITYHTSCVHSTSRIPFKSSLSSLAVYRHQQCETKLLYSKMRRAKQSCAGNECVSLACWLLHSKIMIENKPVFKRIMFVWCLFAYAVMLLLHYWNRERKQQKPLAGLNNVNSPEFESEPVLVMTVYGCLIGTCTFISVWREAGCGSALMHQTGESSLWDAALSQSDWRCQALAPQSEKAGCREKWRRGEMKIKRGTKDKGVCKKWKSKEKFLCWAIPAFNSDW